MVGVRIESQRPPDPECPPFDEEATLAALRQDGEARIQLPQPLDVLAPALIRLARAIKRGGKTLVSQAGADPMVMHLVVRDL